MEYILIMNFCWLTDIHLNFLSKKERMVFYDRIEQKKSDAVIITGDIAEATSVSLLLEEMANALHKPIYFVLGNHDYYHSEIKEVREEMRKLCSKEYLLHWLPMDNRIFLDEDTLLLGQDGWADGRYGNYNDSMVVLNDSRLINDLFKQSVISKNHLLAKMQEFADFDAEKLKFDLIENINTRIKKIIILTHVPPFKEACWHKNEIGNPDWLPFFASKITGDVTLNVAQSNPSIDFLVLCGHTHSRGIYQPISNLLIKTGSAEYYYPDIQEIITI